MMDTFFFKLDDYTTLQIAEEHLEKVRSWAFHRGWGILGESLTQGGVREDGHTSKLRQ
jgi:hypothetical protein